jgi:sulfatase modifying factor 1
MKKTHFLLTVALSGLLAVSTVSAAIDIATVLVGDAGNANDTTGYGGVSYDYHIGTYEVTNSQYTAFLNAVASTDTHGLYDSSMRHGIEQSGSSGSFSYSVKSEYRGNEPVHFVGFWDAARFANYLTSGNTEEGVYDLDGITNPPITENIGRDATAWEAGGVAIASQDEWYKAAYYSGLPTGADGDGYWLYPTQSNSISTADANYHGSPGWLNEVGSFSNDASYYGTFDQGGNVWEWTDDLPVFDSRWVETRTIRGGAMNSFGPFDLQSSERTDWDLLADDYSIGFRVTSLAPIPEPSTYAAIFGSLALTVALVRRKGRGTL